jgi:hypothetical protein
MSVWEVQDTDGKKRLLVSKLNTKYCYGTELYRALKNDYEESRGKGSFDDNAGKPHCLTDLPQEAAERAVGIYESREKLKTKLREIKGIFKARANRMDFVMKFI